MEERVRARLASRFDAVDVGQRLHDVPPHEVWGVVVDGEDAVCKFDTGPTGQAGVEGLAMAFAGHRTCLPVPEILAVGEDWFVAARHPAAPGPAVENDATVDWARAAGEGLATLHAETAPVLDQYGRITHDSSPNSLVVDGHAEWHDAALASVDRLETRLEPYGADDIVGEAIEQLRSRRDVWGEPGPPVLCHGWWSPDHVAVADGAVACVIDFEHAWVAPAAWDLRRTTMVVFDGGDAEKAFREGYASVRPVPDDADTDGFVLLHALYFLESLYVQAQHDATETARRAADLREAIEDLLDDL